jgi:hypothetical protein
LHLDCATEIQEFDFKRVNEKVLRCDTRSFQVKNEFLSIKAVAGGVNLDTSSILVKLDADWSQWRQV